METTRRNFMIAIGSIPFIGAALPKTKPKKIGELPVPDQEAYENPFLYLLRKLNHKKLSDPKFEWFDDGGIQYNYSQIFKNEQHGFKDLERLARLHDMDIERALLFGKRGAINYEYYAIRTTGGIFDFMDTNKYDHGVWDQGRLQRAFKRGNCYVKFLFASNPPVNLFKKYGSKAIMQYGSEYKMDIRRVVTEHGELNIVMSSDRAVKYSAIVDLEKIKLRVFRDQVDIDDWRINGVRRISEVGLQVENENAHSGILEV